MSCRRTFPSISDGAAAAANTSSAAAGAPGGRSVLSNNAIATAGASSVAIATFVADRLVLLRAGVALRLEAGFVARSGVGEGATREVLVMVWTLEMKLDGTIRVPSVSEQENGSRQVPVVSAFMRTIC